MIDQELSSSFYNHINSFSTALPNITRKNILEIFSLYKKILQCATEDSNQLFSSNYARLVYLIDSLKFDKKFSLELKKLHKFFSKIARDKAIKIDQNDIPSMIYILSKLINLSSNCKIPDFILAYLKENKIEGNLHYSLTPKAKYIPFLRGVFKRIIQHDNFINELLLIDTKEFGEILLKINELWRDNIKLLWKNCVVNIFNIKIQNNRESVFELTESSIIVLEPDYLIDVTDISECFQNDGINPYYYFLKKFLESDISESLLIGNLVNFCLDELVVNPLADFEVTYKKAIQYKPLPYFAFYKTYGDRIYQVKEKAQLHFQVLKNSISKLNIEICSVEPSFISPQFGLQGRLDLLLEYYNDDKRKDIVELKSGKAPSIEYTIPINSSKRVRTSIWNNHFAQITCYNLLLDSTYENRTGTSMILYTSDINHSLRNAPNIIQKKQEVIKLRNQIVALERAISIGKFTLLDAINGSTFDGVDYIKENAIEFQKILQNCTEIEKSYFQHFLKFIINEIYFEKFLGDSLNGKSGFSSLWKDSILEKEESRNIIHHLKILQDESDFTNCHLVFKRQDDVIYPSSFRKGDICILYKIDENFNSITSSQILKCYIKDINSDKVIVSLRNKQINQQLIEVEKEWAIEPDYIDATNKALIKSLYKFLSAEKERKELLLGLRPSLNNKRINYYSNYLSEIQFNVVQKAINAKNYFLIQGPPGTGKTSYILRALVEYYISSTDNNILILAYTNRAVDEIFDSISQIKDSESFLRLGSKEASEKKENLIANLAENIALFELYQRIISSRVIVSTVSSVLMNPELFYLKKFNLAIIDEASQILEPQIIGILTQVEKFIMIGDEKQLPAVVVQPEKKLRIKSDLLKKIYLYNLGNSLFERLLNICKANEWNDSYDMLTQQARMHKGIQTLANGLFYSGKLVHFDYQWQKSNNIDFYDKSFLTYDFLANERIIFIESDLEDNLKIHIQEARRVALLIEAIMKSYKKDIHNKTIGVITPFRAQCSKIYQEMNPKYRNLVAVDTVERFQGSEREVIIISFATNHKYLLKNVQSLTYSDVIAIDRKLNVAITRSKQQLIILGVKEILMSSPIFSNMLKYINVIGKIIDKKNAKEYF